MVLNMARKEVKTEMSGNKKTNGDVPVSSYLKPDFGRLDEESKSDKNWEINYGKKQRSLRNRRKRKVFAAVIILFVTAAVILIVSGLKEKKKRDVLEADKQEYLQLLYVQCVQGTNSLDGIELVKQGVGHYDLFVDSLNDIMKLNDNRSSMELAVAGFSSFDMTIEQIYQNLKYGQESYQYQAFDADSALSEEEINYLTNLRRDFQLICDAIYPNGHFNNMTGEEIGRLFSDVIKKYRTNSDIRTFSDKYRIN